MSAPDDELVRRYREASAQEDARPGAQVRDAVRAHAQMLAAAAATAPSPTAAPLTRAAANQSRWKISALATVAVVGLTGLLMLQFERGSPEEKEVAYGQRRAEAPAPAALPAPPPAPSTAPAAETNSAAPSAAAGLPDRARDTAIPPARSTAQKPASAAPGQARPLAKTAPAPAPAIAAPEAESSPGRSAAGAVSGFPASPPMTAEKAITPRPAPPPAPSAAPAPRAEMRERSVAQDGAASREVVPQPQAMPSAAAPAAAAAARSLQGGNAANGKLAATAPSADAGSSALLSQQLWEASRTGDPLQVESLVRQGAPIDARGSAGRTALMLAAIHGQATAVQKLLALGANRTLVDREGLNAAQQARQRGHARIADLIEAEQR
ncbi:ankyrin repeat domain-containing protein [Acidovorax sp. sif1233]|uniref:ankyrin repeat domain-containing protein n=1 Tax=Acidovorax sp. sif1233 TaxID=2854792 RepID=UPI001C486028|nr:ankyrin repeat domain-containing protein [Acidovorax sp. sif1233]MBV7454498.1 ankyrin repeat domain-containing protein [Acidovorax sp. sif1233]